MAWVTGEVPMAELSYPSAFHTSPGALAGRWVLTDRSSIFVHARNTADRQALIPGSKVSFIYAADEKGGKAKEVTAEEMTKAIVLEEGPREMGTVKVSFTALAYLSLRLFRTRGFRNH